MNELIGKMPTQLERNLNLAADRAFQKILQDLLGNPTDVYDYPVGSLVLDESGSLILGEGVATDMRTCLNGAHAETNALIEAGKGDIKPAIVVTTLESCNMCRTNAINQLGNNGLIAYVTSRKYAEGLGHVTPRNTTNSVENDITQRLLPHPRLEAKGQALLRNVTRDPRTGITIVNRAPLESLFGRIDETFPLES